MHRHGEVVRGIRHAEQSGAEERSCGEVERRIRLPGRQAYSRLSALAFRQRRQIRNAQGEGRHGHYPLNGLASLAGKDRAQCVLASDQIGETTLKGGNVEIPVQAQDAGNVVGGPGLLELCEKPQAPLREGKLGVRADGTRLGRPCWKRARFLAGKCRRLRLDPRRELGDGGGVVHIVDCDLDGKAAPHARDQPRGSEGIAAKLEKVILNTHPVEFE